MKIDYFFNQLQDSGSVWGKVKYHMSAPYCPGCTDFSSSPGFDETAFVMKNNLPTKGNQIFLEQDFQTFEVHLISQEPRKIIFETPYVAIYF